MKKNILLITFIICTPNLFSQIGKSYTNVQKIYGNKSIEGLELRSEHNYLVEDKQVSKTEKRMIIYNKDSIAIGIGISFNNKTISEEEFNNLIMSEVPKCKLTKSAKTKNSSFKFDSENNYLVILNSENIENLYPLKSLFILIDPKIIEQWIIGIKWKEI